MKKAICFEPASNSHPLATGLCQKRINLSETVDMEGFGKNRLHPDIINALTIATAGCQQ